MGDFRFIFGEGEPSHREKILHKRDNFIFQCFVCGSSDHKSSQPGELPPELLTEPDVNLSAQPAPIV